LGLGAQHFSVAATVRDSGNKKRGRPVFTGRPGEEGFRSVQFLIVNGSVKVAGLGDAREWKGPVQFEFTF